MALVLLAHENLGKDKHVESLLFPRLDEGSIPSSSTNEILKPLNFSGFFISIALLPFLLPTIFFSYPSDEEMAHSSIAISFGGVFWVFPVFGIRHPDSN